MVPPILGDPNMNILPGKEEEGLADHRHNGSDSE